MNKEIIENYWNKFIKDTGQNSDLKYYDVFHFELTEKLANELLELVLSGVKKATSSCLYQFEHEGNRLPKVGDISIVTDFHDTPKCIIETTKVSIIPFKDITFDICKREGEDDSLESWRFNHIKFFKSLEKELGFEFTLELPVVFEEFKLIYK